MRCWSVVARDGLCWHIGAQPEGRVVKTRIWRAGGSLAGSVQYENPEYSLITCMILDNPGCSAISRVTADMAGIFLDDSQNRQSNVHQGSLTVRYPVIWAS